MLSFILVLFMHCDAQAQTTKSPSKMSTNIYEKEEDKDESKSFTAKVRVVRDIGDDVEVFFDSDAARGAYTLPRNAAGYSQMYKDLEKSKAPSGPAVSVTADTDKRIKSVQLQSAPARDPSDPWKIDSPYGL